jgi:hypothetical protein
MRRALPLVTTLLLALTLPAGEAAPVELREQPYDIVMLSNGQELQGTVVEQRGDGSLLFRPTISKEIITIPGGTWREPVRWRLKTPKVVEEAGKAALLGRNQRNLIEAVRWGVDKGAADAALAAALAWLAQTPGDRDVLGLAMPLLKAKSDWATLEKLARAGIAADRNWGEGDQLVVEALGAQSKSAELEAYAKQWLGRNPTALNANLICGASFERAGDLRPARECYRKAWELHKNEIGALGFARTSLMTGNYADAQRASAALPASAEAKAYGAAAAAAAGDLAAAKKGLEGFAADALPGPAAQAGTYALGLVAFREGRTADAVKHWQAVQTPSAQFALAIAQRREFAGAERLAPDLRGAARLLNASIRLENRHADKAVELIDQHLDGRHSFLHRVAQVLANSGSPESVRALTAVRTPESQRWQLYGHLVGGRFDEAEQLARTFPANDGYALACRVFLAAARSDPEGARMLYEGSGGLPGAPPEYARRLAELYNTADDQVVTEAFDWPEGEVLATGWEPLISGTGISVRAGGGRLVMDGVQSANAEDPVTRAVIAVPGSRFRLARLAVDISAAAGAHVGLELLDGARKNGVAVAAVGGLPQLQWRQLASGRWSEWRELPYAVTGTTAVMSLDFSGGRVFAADPADPLQRTQLSDVLARVQGDWSLGVFGTAAPGTAWKAGFDDLRWRLRPEKK